MTAVNLTVFNSVLGGPTAYLYGAGWTLLGIGFACAWANDNMQLALTGKSDKGTIVGRLIYAVGALSAYTLISGAIWYFFQTTAATVYPRDALSGIGVLMATAAQRFQDYSFNAFSAAASLKDGLVIFGALAAFAAALLGWWNVQTFQVVGYNTVFALGPLLIGMSTFGLPTIRTWLLLTVELSSWTVIQAVVFRCIEGRLTYYLQRASTLPLLSVEFLDLFGQLGVLATMPVVIPALAGRLFGIGAGAAFASAPSILPSPAALAAAVGGFLGGRAGSNSRKSETSVPHPGKGMDHVSPSRSRGDV